MQRRWEDRLGKGNPAREWAEEKPLEGVSQRGAASHLFHRRIDMAFFSCAGNKSVRFRILTDLNAWPKEAGKFTSRSCTVTIYCDENPAAGRWGGSGLEPGHGGVGWVSSLCSLVGDYPQLSERQLELLRTSLPQDR